MSLFLSACPLWISAILLVILPTAAASIGLILVRRRVGLERLSTNNEVAGFKFAVVGVLYAVLLAFAVIVVWERYSDGEAAVMREAGAAANLYRLAGGPEPDAVATREALGAYLKSVLLHDWPKMAKEGESLEATRALNTLYGACLSLAQRGTRQSAVVVEIFNQLDAITQQRRDRLHLATGIVPTVLWVALTIGGVLTVSFTFFFGTENLSAQVMMTAVLAFTVFMGVYVIVVIDHPFTGPVHVDGAPLERVLEDFGTG